MKLHRILAAFALVSILASPVMAKGHGGHRPHVPHVPHVPKGK